MHGPDTDNPLAVEIRQEMASAYFAECRKMVASLDALKEFDRSISMKESPPLTTEHSAHRSNLVAVAAERVYFVLIQREAMGLYRNDVFLEDYEVPAEVRECLGPRRQR